MLYGLKHKKEKEMNKSEEAFVFSKLESLEQKLNILLDLQWIQQNKNTDISQQEPRDPKV